MKRAIVFLVAMMAFAPAWAGLPKPSDVAAAVNVGHLHKAERMMHEVIAAHPSPKAHYLLGEVYALEHEPHRAFTQLSDARRGDPSLSFAGSRAHFRNLYVREARATGHASASRPSPTRRGGGSSLAYLLCIFLTLLLLGAIIGTIAMVRARKREKLANRLHREEMQRLMNEQNKQVLDVLEKLDMAESFCADGKDEAKGQVQDAEATLRDWLKELRDNTAIERVLFTRYISYAQALCDAVLNHEELPEKMDPQAERRERETRAAQSGYALPPEYRDGHRQARLARGQGGNVTVVNNNGGGDGLLEGLLLGEMLSDDDGRRDDVGGGFDSGVSGSWDTGSNGFDSGAGGGFGGSNGFDSGGGDWGGGSNGFDSGGSNNW